MNSSTVPVYERTDPGMGDIASTKPLQHQNTAYFETILIHTINGKSRTIFLYFYSANISRENNNISISRIQSKILKHQHIFHRKNKISISERRYYLLRLFRVFNG